MHTLIALGLALASVQAPAVTTQFVTSKDGTKIAYDVAGSGPVVILLHGGGTNNEGAYASAKQYQGTLAGTKVTLEIVEGLNHPQEFESIDRVFPREVEFTRANAR